MLARCAASAHLFSRVESHSNTNYGDWGKNDRSLGSRVYFPLPEPINIQVNAIAPGFIDTEMVAPLKTMPLYEEIIAPTPAGRFGTPEQCAETAIYLASQASDFVTGTTRFLDGSFAIR